LLSDFTYVSYMVTTFLELKLDLIIRLLWQEFQHVASFTKVMEPINEVWKKIKAI